MYNLHECLLLNITHNFCFGRSEIQTQEPIFIKDFVKALDWWKMFTTCTPSLGSFVILKICLSWKYCVVLIFICWVTSKNVRHLCHTINEWKLVSFASPSISKIHHFDQNILLERLEVKVLIHPKPTLCITIIYLANSSVWQ